MSEVLPTANIWTVVYIRNAWS